MTDKKFLDIIKTRRSIRKYKDRDIPDDIIKELINTARHAPYGGGVKEAQLWEFIVIRDKTIKEKLTHDDKDRKFLIEAPFIIACCADTSRDPEYRDYDITVSLAIENLLLAAHSLGLGACYVTTYPNHVEKTHQEKYRKLCETLKLPKHIRLIALIALGYPDEKTDSKELRSLKEIIHYKKW